MDTDQKQRKIIRVVPCESVAQTGFFSNLPEFSDIAGFVTVVT
jgi:hypothetical protein